MVTSDTQCQTSSTHLFRLVTKTTARGRDLARRLARYRRRVEAEGRPRSLRLIDRAIADAGEKAHRDRLIAPGELPPFRATARQSALLAEPRAPQHRRVGNQEQQEGRPPGEAGDLDPHVVVDQPERRSDAQHGARGHQQID